MNAHYTMDLAAELALRQRQTPVPDTSEGMALVYHFEVSERWSCIGIFTVAFIRTWCAGDPAYRWERI